MRGLVINKNIPIYITKLVLTVNHRAITGSPNMSLLLEDKSTPALIIKPSLILLVDMDDFGWYKTCNQ